jgi:DNA gyrase/topoisomerase IV subunit A
MSLIDQDLPWLTTEARNDPDTAQQIVEALAGRVQTLQRQTDELRAENALLKRNGGQQASSEQLQRLKTHLHDFRQLAIRRGLDQDVVSLITFTGMGMQLPAPAPMEQTLSLLTPPNEPIGMQKPLYLAHSNWFGSLLAITSTLRLSLVNGLSLPVSDRLDWRDARPVTSLGLARAERVEAILRVDELHPPHDILIVSRQGWVRAISWTHAEMLAYSTQTMTLPGMGDTPVWLGEYDAHADLLILTRNGRWTRFPLGLVPSLGCAGITLESDDDVVSAVVLGKREEVVWFIGADGSLVAVHASGLEPHKKPNAKSVALSRKFAGLTCFGISAKKTEMALLLSNQGDLHVVNMHGLPIASKPSELQLLKVSNQRLIAATLL